MLGGAGPPETLPGHLDHWLRLTRQQEGAHLNNYEIDLGNDNTGRNQKDLYRNGRDSSWSSLGPQLGLQPLP